MGFWKKKRPGDRCSDFWHETQKLTEELCFSAASPRNLTDSTRKHRPSWSTPHAHSSSTQPNPTLVYPTQGIHMKLVSFIYDTCVFFTYDVGFLYLCILYPQDLESTFRNNKVVVWKKSQEFRVWYNSVKETYLCKRNLKRHTWVKQKMHISKQQSCEVEYIHIFLIFEFSIHVFFTAWTENSNIYEFSHFETTKLWCEIIHKSSVYDINSSHLFISFIRQVGLFYMCVFRKVVMWNNSQIFRIWYTFVSFILNLFYMSSRSLLCQVGRFDMCVFCKVVMWK